MCFHHIEGLHIHRAVAERQPKEKFDLGAILDFPCLLLRSKQQAVTVTAEEHREEGLCVLGAHASTLYSERTDEAHSGRLCRVEGRHKRVCVIQEAVLEREKHLVCEQGHSTDSSGMYVPLE